MAAADSLIGEGLAPSPYSEMRALAQEACKVLNDADILDEQWDDRRYTVLLKAKELLT